MFVSLAGIAELISASAAFPHWSGMLVGPTLLVVGAICLARKANSKIGVALIATGCAVLTGLVAYQVFVALHPKPLEAKQPYGPYLVAIGIALISDVSAMRVSWLALHRSTQ
jgi:hypothetical protein